MKFKCPEGSNGIAVGGVEYLARAGTIDIPEEFESVAIAAGYTVVGAPAPALIENVVETK